MPCVEFCRVVERRRKVKSLKSFVLDRTGRLIEFWRVNVAPDGTLPQKLVRSPTGIEGDWGRGLVTNSPVNSGPSVELEESGLGSAAVRVVPSGK